MIPDADYVYEGLLGYNYLPMVKRHRDDIPSTFHTEDLTPEIGDKLVSHSQRMRDDQKYRRKYGYDHIEYRTTRFNNLLRLMHIPHPLAYAPLCACLRDNWGNVQHICHNTHSMVKPEQHADGRVYVLDEYDSVNAGRIVVMEQDRFPADAERHLNLSFGARYVVRADVSACFPSIYTHAIPWALVGHDIAKECRATDKWYNKIDCLQRNMRRNETQGIPIGPASSNIVSEVVLAAVDDVLATDYSFVRYIDDYRCYVTTQDEADKFIRDLERELSRYLLSLNARKIAIVPLPQPSRDPWVTGLSRLLRPVDEVTQRDVVDLLDAAIELQNEYPHRSVVKYAARMLELQVTDEAADLALRYLLQIAWHYPVVLPIACSVAKASEITVEEHGGSIKPCGN